MFKKLLFRNNTLSRDYYVFSAIVGIVVIGLSLLWTAQAYYLLNSEKEVRYESEAGKISDALVESFNYLESFMSIVGNDVAKLDKPNPQAVATILEKGWPRLKDKGYNYFSWSVLDFSTPDGQILASSVDGVLNPPAQLPKKRKWLSEGPRRPGKLIFSEPDIGVLTKQYILPVGYGITNKNGRYVGAISIGLNLKNLTSKLQAPLSHSKTASFMILDSDYKIVTQSSDNKQVLDKDFFSNKITSELFANSVNGTLAKPIDLDNVSYYYFRKVSDYPFYLLMGDNNDFLNKEFNKLIMPRIIQTVVLGLFFIVLLYFFRRSVIGPVIKLSEAALAISQGRTDVEIPKSDIKEYQVLGKQLTGIRDMLTKLNKAQKDLQEALLAKSSFLSNMSHEFRTPLNAVIGFSETIKHKIFGDLNEKYSEYVENINEQGQYLLKLIEEILDASKIESGKAQLDEEPLDFKRLVRESIKTVQLRAEQKGISMITEFPEDLPYINADKTKIKQVLLNFLSNAVKFTAEDGKVYIRARIEEEFIFEIQDTGIGIASDDLKRITQRFTQFENIYTKKNRGTGLGMSISKDIVELHGGRMTIESEVNIGTKITVYLPQDRIIFGI